jgi:hypothetical protein
MSVNVDPRIKIQTVSDGEIHLVCSLSKDDLAQYALVFIGVCDGRMQAEDVKTVLRLRSEEGIDYLISELQKARRELFCKKDGEA